MQIQDQRLAEEQARAVVPNERDAQVAGTERGLNREAERGAVQTWGRVWGHFKDEPIAKWQDAEDGQPDREPQQRLAEADGAHEAEGEPCGQHCHGHPQLHQPEGHQEMGRRDEDPLSKVRVEWGDQGCEQGWFIFYITVFSSQST